MADLEHLASLIAMRNRVAAEITKVMGRPALIGHVGEFIASLIFEIDLIQAAAAKAIDGHFRGGTLRGRSVNVKWYAKHEGVLDITPEALPEFYLVMAGPRASAESSRGTVRPWAIESVHLFEASQLVTSLREHGVKIGVATSVRGAVWSEAEIYPQQNTRLLVLSAEQRRQVELFSGRVT